MRAESRVYPEEYKAKSIFVMISHLELLLKNYDQSILYIYWLHHKISLKMSK